MKDNNSGKTNLSSGNPKTTAHALKKKISSLPRKPGIYFFKNNEGGVVYIGKARSIRDRVKTYFQTTPDPKIKNILSETRDMDYILTDSEKEASFLENNFIRRHLPKFNLKLKDDKSFPFVKLTLREDYPGIYFTRKVKKDGARYFGPFSPALQARKSIRLVTKTFKLRTCRESIPGRRKRPCLEYDLQLCSAPCIGAISQKEYGESVKNALLFLEGKTDKLLENLKKKMKEASERMEFEKAALWRDAITTIEEIRTKPKLISAKKENLDIIGYARSKTGAAFYVFNMRGGKVIESKEFFRFVEAGNSDPDILKYFLEEFLAKGTNDARKVLLPFSPAQSKGGSRQTATNRQKMLAVPARGIYKKLVGIASSNAAVLLEKAQQDIAPLEEIKGLFDLKRIPIRIEAFDISNTGGDESVGSMVVFQNGKPSRNEYRKFKIKTIDGPNDTASLEEVIQRRYSRVLREKQPLPDLILVDGGKGQLNAALTALQDPALKHIPVLSLAKREETIFQPGKKTGTNLDPTSLALKLFQHMRDEAHRFAITFHRIRREKKSFSSMLDGIPGIGPVRKKTLLERFKNISAIQNALPGQLEKIVGKKAAIKLRERLVSGNSKTGA
ncbi:MAG: excinuclease ABC subunit UvrC [Candidatus Aminicenantes bacterium]|nr:excinuclease ABC subunit UvrC [Candidatus Aminicenantes bacterium]